MHGLLRYLLVCALLAAMAGSASAERTILADTYLDKLEGMWLGQLLGNYAGKPTEGVYNQTYPRGNPAESVSWDFVDTISWWSGDDDTVFEHMYALVLSTQPDPTDADLKSAWQTHVPAGGFYVANKQARLLMDPPADLAPPDTGSFRYNAHAYAIDSEITTESIGAMTPGSRQRAVDLTALAGGVTNDGYALHTAEYYAALYAAASLQTTADAATIEQLVIDCMDVLPNTSRTRDVVQDVLAWYQADLAAHQADPNDPLDWRDTREALCQKYATGPAAMGRYRNWLESTMNAGCTVLSLLYGQGDFKETVRVGVLAGFDADCNPASTGGLIGLLTGRAGLPTDLTTGPETYVVGGLQNLDTVITLSEAAQVMQSAAELQILEIGGSISGSGATKTYHLPDADDVTAPADLPDPSGPRGLVAAVRDAGGSASISARIETHQADDDRTNLDAVIDGIIDTSHNGHLAYWTRDGYYSPGDEDWYCLAFDRDVTFTRLLFHEGDLVAAHVNSDPRTQTPRGGYFLDLIVEVGDDGVFTPVSNLAFSEALDPFTIFQQIELTFDMARGDAIRIRGTAGGTEGYTTILELEAFGILGAPMPGDTDVDGDVDLTDLAILAGHWDTETGMTWRTGDFDGDGDTDLSDLALLASNYGRPTAMPPVPEPTSLILLPAAIVLMRSRRAYG